MLPTPTSHQHPPLFSALRAACLCLLPLTASDRTYIFPPGTAPRSLSSSGGFASRGDLRLPCVSASTSLCVSPFSGIFWCLLSLSGVCFRARAREKGASTPWQSLVLVLSPSLPVHSGAVQAPRTPPPHPLVFLIPSRPLKLVGFSTRISRYARILQSW